jgi:hypothetical protein
MGENSEVPSMEWCQMLGNLARTSNSACCFEGGEEMIVLHLL